MARMKDKLFEPGQIMDADSLSSAHNSMVERLDTLEEEVRRLKDDMLNMIILNTPNQNNDKSPYEMDADEYLAQDHKL